jgi:hypothetical protein
MVAQRTLGQREIILDSVEQDGLAAPRVARRARSGIDSGARS